ncbi:hypothetical protein IV54_GL000831 [Levilactobacillus paucivorans]|uniref:SRPBCC family protein n=1 Tax=Levilactobacillus paucivorans TaxID=616990 RepID=A0A0R2LUF8_9LACO|nr:hypothetical protein [Levilactobacillus paucivorans]KRO04806.1 hypothetical protein IV54_GL000831 [Levilactobacillus paucivorans]
MTNTAVFTNEVLAQATVADSQKVLADPQALLKWVPDITTVAAGANAFEVTRQDAALNQHERITVTATAGQVTYESTQGRLAYRLVFTLTAQEAGTRIREALYVPDHTGLPIKLMAPIAKRAFYQNLTRLAQIVAS